MVHRSAVFNALLAALVAVLPDKVAVTQRRVPVSGLCACQLLG